MALRENLAKFSFFAVDSLFSDRLGKWRSIKSSKQKFCVIFG